MSELSVERVRTDIQKICNEIPTRLAGSAAGKQMAEYSLAGLKAAGADARIHEMPGLVSFPEPGSLEILSPDTRKVDAFTLGHSVPTAPSGLEGQLVDCGAGGYKDYEGRDVAGKIVLVELSYHPGRHEKQRIAAQMGAIGCVMMNWGHAESAVLPFGSVKPAWGNPTPETNRTEMATLPCIGISRVEGLKLRAGLASAKMRVRFHARVENCWKPIQITIGELPGTASEDFMILGGHQDSWFGQQATDNAAGNSVKFELARYFAKHPEKLKRGVRFAFWTAHETGTMIGSTWYVDRHWKELRDRCIAYLQIDQPACAGTTRWGAVCNNELKRFQEGVDARLVGDLQRIWRRSNKIGDASFYGVGVPMMVGQGVYTDAELKNTANATLGWWHHSTENTPDKIDYAFLQRHLDVYAAYVTELCTAEVLPFEFTSTAADVTKRLEELKPSGAGLGFDAVLGAAAGFAERAKQLEAKAGPLREQYKAGSLKSGEPAKPVNDCLKALSRTLLPIVGTAKGTYGHDPYAYTPQTTLLPALYDVSAYGKLADGEEKWMLETQLVRELNRIGDALDRASAQVAEALKS